MFITYTIMGIEASLPILKTNKKTNKETKKETKKETDEPSEIINS